MNRLINHEAVYRTAPATQGLLNTSDLADRQTDRQTDRHYDLET